MVNALVIYASWTGTTMEIANILATELRALKIETSVKACTEAYPSEFQQVNICVVATYTYGSDGALPEEAEDFFDDLEDVDLYGKIYGVLGSGDRVYKKFCPAVDYFADQFEKTGATRGSDLLKINLQPDEHDKLAIKEFARNLIDALARK